MLSILDMRSWYEQVLYVVNPRYEFGLSCYQPPIWVRSFMWSKTFYMSYVFHVVNSRYELNPSGCQSSFEFSLFPFDHFETSQTFVYTYHGTAMQRGSNEKKMLHLIYVHPKVLSPHRLLYENLFSTLAGLCGGYKFFLLDNSFCHPWRFL